MSETATTLSRYVIDQQHQHAGASGEIASLITQIGQVGQLLSREVQRAALAGQLGLAGGQNPTGDSQKKLDILSNQIVLDVFANSSLVAAIASEELDQVKCIGCDIGAPYVLCTDPLDGSSNTDVNAPVGTIFGIYRRKGELVNTLEEEFIRPASDQVAAGYVLYSSSTMLVYTNGDGVRGFTLDPDMGEFVLSHDSIRCPPQGETYSVNMGHYAGWHQSVQQYADRLMHPDSSYSLRYSGALVADFHRCLLEGGIYFYPPDEKHDQGKLRLLYECAPLAFVAEQAGGRASTGIQRVLDVRSEAIHQRSPLVIGSAEDVALYEEFLRATG